MLPISLGILVGPIVAAVFGGLMGGVGGAFVFAAGGLVLGALGGAVIGALSLGFMLIGIGLRNLFHRNSSESASSQNEKKSGLQSSYNKSLGVLLKSDNVQSAPIVAAVANPPSQPSLFFRLFTCLFCCKKGEAIAEVPEENLVGNKKPQ